VKISIFLSYPKPCLQRQAAFIKRICAHLESRGLEPRTLGVTDYDMDAPLKAIRRLMMESHGLITVAFRRTYIEKGVAKYGTDLLDQNPSEIKERWLTTPWAHIEPAMAYQLGLPILILREEGVWDDGILEKGVLGNFMPEFNLDKPLDEYFSGFEWSGIIEKWEGYVRTVVENKGNPPRLY
jgi:hypothetical protein